MANSNYVRSKVIEDSVSLFWRHGFNGASMQQVVKATGLKPGSIYHAFGNKEDLYCESLEQYATKSFKEIRLTLDNANSIGSGLCTLLRSITDASKNTDYCSCFLIKSQLELSAEGGKIYDYASEKLLQTEKLYQSYLEKEYSVDESAIKATSIMLHIFGIRVYGYQNTTDSKDKMLLALEQALPWLPWHEINC